MKEAIKHTDSNVFSEKYFICKQMDKRAMKNTGGPGGKATERSLEKSLEIKTKPQVGWLAGLPD